MGYTTDFAGAFTVTPPLNSNEVAYLNDFAASRRMKRNPEEIKKLDPDWKQHCFYGNLGKEGAYWLNPSDLSNYGQTPDKSIIDYNTPPAGQPGLWCQWVASEDGTTIEWDGGEKFYNYIEWITYLIDNFIAPNNHLVNGEVDWQGEDMYDRGTIVIEDNVVNCLTVA